MFTSTAFHALRSRFRGALLRPDEAGYDQVRRVWNGAIDRKPALIARAAGADDVQTAIRFAREQGLAVSVRGGGHSVAGHGVVDDGLMIDLSLLKSVRIEPSARSATAAAGLTWGEFDRATQRHGLATPGGSVSSTGIAGLTVGGGFGHLLRRHGLTADNLHAVQLVAADGELIGADDRCEPELIWGLRGGGGNFGIVTSFEYRLHPVGPLILAGPVFWGLEDSAQVLRFVNQLAATAPDDLGIGIYAGAAPPLPFLPPGRYGSPVLGLLLSWAGDPAAGRQVLAPLLTCAPPIGAQVGLVPYRALQTLLDGNAQPGNHAYWRSVRLPELSEPVLSEILNATASRTSPLSLLNGWVIGGAASRVPASGTAVGSREPGFELRLIAVWPDDNPDPQRHRQWVIDHWQRLQPTSQGQFATFLSDEDPALVRQAYGAGWERLTALKKRYDPDNFFHLNANIQPSQGGTS